MLLIPEVSALCHERVVRAELAGFVIRAGAELRRLESLRRLLPATAAGLLDGIKRYEDACLLLIIAAERFQQGIAA